MKLVMTVVVYHTLVQKHSALLRGGLVGMCLTFWDNSEQQRYLERHSFISVSFGITGERSNSTKASFCPHCLLMEWDREREPRGGCAEPGEKPEQGEPRCKSRVDSPVWARYRGRGAGCAAGPPPQRWWPRRCSGRHLQAGPCQVAGHGPRPPAVPKHREEPCDTPAPSTAARGERTQPGSSPPNPSSWNKDCFSEISLGQQHQELYRCEETWLVRGRQAEETAGKVPKTAPAIGNQSHCKHSPPEHASTGEGSSWKGRISPGEGNYRYLLQ